MLYTTIRLVAGAGLFEAMFRFKQKQSDAKRRNCNKKYRGVVDSDHEFSARSRI